jgi:hypothetical protein
MANNFAYGLGAPLQYVFAAPVVALRNPANTDTGYDIGQIWVNSSAFSSYTLTGFNSNGVPQWVVNTQSGAGSFASLIVTPGPVTLSGTTNINASGASVTTIGTGGTGAVHIGNATGNTAVTGSLTASTTLTAAAGNITATNGNVVLSTAATYLALPGPIRIQSGAGAPAAGLAVEVGDIYINTTAASAVTRIYVATAAGTWTNITCAA